MSNPLPLTIDFGTLPNNGQGYTPQELADRLGINGRIFTEQAFALFTTGATAPTSDTGPWAANGNTWYYWDPDLGQYVPFLIPPESLKYSVSSVEPDPTKYLFWIQLDGGGSPLAVKTYYSGAWVDVYASALGDYMTVAEFNTAIAAYSTTTEMNAAITAAITAALAPYSTTAQMNTAISAAITAALASYTNTAGMTAAINAGDAATLASANGYTNSQIAALTSYPGQGYRTASPQSISTDGTPVKATLEGASINPAPAPIDVGNSRYVAPSNGIYSVTISTQIDNDTADAGSVEAEVDIYKNGVSTGIGDLDNTPSPTGGRWTPAITTLIQLVATDYIEAFIRIDDTPGTNAVNLSKIFLSVNRVSS